MIDIKHNHELQQQIVESIYFILLDCTEGLWDSLDVRRAHLKGKRLDKKPKMFKGPYLVKIGRNTESQTLFNRNKSYRKLTTLPNSMEPVFDQKLMEHSCYNFTGMGTDFIKQTEKDLKKWVDSKYKPQRYTTSEYYELQSMEQVEEFKQHLQNFFLK